MFSDGITRRVVWGGSDAGGTDRTIHTDSRLEVVEWCREIAIFGYLIGPNLDLIISAWILDNAI